MKKTIYYGFLITFIKTTDTKIMKKISLFAALTLTLLACKKDTEKPVETVKQVVSKATPTEKWETLFDGENLNAWRGYGEDNVPSEWSIENGELKFTPGKEGGKNLITKKKYTNFVLELEWKISEGGNSGIFWGVHEAPEFKEAYETGLEVQVLDDERHPDADKGGRTHRAGALYDLIQPTDRVVNPAGEWNFVKISVNHHLNQAKVSMNGSDMYALPVKGPRFEKLIANSKFKDWKGFGKFSNGHIGLQDHGDVVWYRNIRIKNIY